MPPGLQLEVEGRAHLPQVGAESMSARTNMLCGLLPQRFNFRTAWASGMVRPLPAEALHSRADRSPCCLLPASLAQRTGNRGYCQGLSIPRALFVSPFPLCRRQ